MTPPEKLNDENAFSGDFHNAASRFLSFFDTAVRQAQIYELENKVMEEPIARVAGALEGLVEQDGSFGFQDHDDSVFVQGQRLRCDGPTYHRHRAFLDFLGGFRIRGVRFLASLSEGEWGDFVQAVGREERGRPECFDVISRRLDERRLDGKIQLLESGGNARLQRVMRIQVENRSFAARTYAKAMYMLRLYLKHLDNPVRLGFHHLKLQRVVQDLVAVCHDHGWRYLGLVNNKGYDDYLYNHSVNVALLSLIIGERLGFRRTRLGELGMSAILHDLGKSMLPEGLLDKKGLFSDEDREKMKEHPLLGIRALLRVRQYNESLLKRIMVVCEHHRTLTDEETQHAYSRIVAVAETFDALTSPRPYRPAYLPDDAIRLLIRMGGDRLDENLVSTFVQTVGLYPSGTLLDLSTGEMAIAFHPHPDPKEWRTPIARVIRDRHGREIKELKLVDLSERSGDGNFRRIIKGTRHPAAEGIAVSGYLYAEGDQGVKGVPPLA